MEDIARLAGVSKSAVSLAFGGKPGIGQETRNRILGIAKEHGYVPKTRSASQDSAGRALTFLVAANSGIVLEQYYQQPFFRELIQYIEERCRAAGYSLMFSSMNIRDLENGSCTFAEEKRSEGTILLGTNLSRSHIENISSLLSSRLVVLDTCYETLPVHFVEINNRMGAYQAGVHLCELGHRTIGYVASTDRIRNFDARRSGFRAALKEYDLQVADNHTFQIAPTILTSQESMKEQLLVYLKSGQPLPSAFFCECDYIAISVMKTLSELGYRIPDEISIVGFDNITESMIVTPELSTIHVEKKTMAQIAVDLMVQSIESEPGIKTKVSVDTRLIERNSSRAVVADAVDKQQSV